MQEFFLRFAEFLGNGVVMFTFYRMMLGRMDATSGYRSVGRDSDLAEPLIRHREEESLSEAPECASDDQLKLNYE